MIIYNEVSVGTALTLILFRKRFALKLSAWQPWLFRFLTWVSRSKMAESNSIHDSRWNSYHHDYQNFAMVVLSAYPFHTPSDCSSGWCFPLLRQLSIVGCFPLAVLWKVHHSLHSWSGTWIGAFSSQKYSNCEVRWSEHVQIREKRVSSILVVSSTLNSSHATVEISSVIDKGDAIVSISTFITKCLLFRVLLIRFLLVGYPHPRSKRFACHCTDTLIINERMISFSEVFK